MKHYFKMLLCIGAAASSCKPRRTSTQLSALEDTSRDPCAKVAEELVLAPPVAVPAHGMGFRHGRTDRTMAFLTSKGYVFTDHAVRGPGVEQGSKLIDFHGSETNAVLVVEDQFIVVNHESSTPHTVRGAFLRVERSPNGQYFGVLSKDRTKFHLIDTNQKRASERAERVLTQFTNWRAHYLRNRGRSGSRPEDSTLSPDRVRSQLPSYGFIASQSGRYLFEIITPGESKGDRAKGGFGHGPRLEQGYRSFGVTDAGEVIAFDGRYLSQFAVVESSDANHYIEKGYSEQNISSGGFRGTKTTSKTVKQWKDEPPKIVRSRLYKKAENDTTRSAIGRKIMSRSKFLIPIGNKKVLFDAVTTVQGVDEREATSSSILSFSWKESTFEEASVNTVTDRIADAEATSSPQVTAMLSSPDGRYLVIGNNRGILHIFDQNESNQFFFKRSLRVDIPIEGAKFEWTTLSQIKQAYSLYISSSTATRVFRMEMFDFPFLLGTSEGQAKPGSAGHPLAAHAPKDRMTSDQKAVYAVAISPDCRAVAAGGADGTLKEWRLLGYREGHGFPEAFSKKVHSDRITAVRYSKNRDFLLTASLDGSVKIHNIEGHSLIPARHLAVGRPIYDAILSHDEGTVLFAQEGRPVQKIAIAQMPAGLGEDPYDGSVDRPERPPLPEDSSESSPDQEAAENRISNLSGSAMHSKWDEIFSSEDAPRFVRLAKHDYLDAEDQGSSTFGHAYGYLSSSWHMGLAPYDKPEGFSMEHYCGLKFLGQIRKSQSPTALGLDRFGVRYYLGTDGGMLIVGINQAASNCLRSTAAKFLHQTADQIVPVATLAISAIEEDWSSQSLLIGALDGRVRKIYPYEVPDDYVPCFLYKDEAARAQCESELQIADRPLVISDFNLRSPVSSLATAASGGFSVAGSFDGKVHLIWIGRKIDIKDQQAQNSIFKKLK